MTKIKNVSINWEFQKDKLKEKFTNLTERDLYFEKGKMDVMLLKLQEKLGITRHKLFTIIADL
jgi:uncharacterized protein YjbJ (UPF0337 family)